MATGVGVGAGATGVAGSEALRGWRWRMGMAEQGA